MDILPNNLNIQLKIIKYNKEDNELDIRIVPVLGFKIPDEIIVNINDEVSYLSVEAIPVIPTIVSTDEMMFYEFNNNIYDLSWRLTNYTKIKAIFEPIGSS